MRDAETETPLECAATARQVHSSPACAEGNSRLPCAHPPPPPCVLLVQVTLFTRGKTPIAAQIPDDTPESFAKFKSSIKHIAGDRLVRAL